MIGALRVPWLLVSCSDEGFMGASELHELLVEVGYIARIDVEHKRYVGAQIGIHNPAGRKVGTVSHLRNCEHLFVVGPDRSVVERAAAVSGALR